jgi:hypothetical protein
LQNVVKCGKYSLANFANFVYFCVACGNCYRKWLQFPHAIQKYTRFANFARLYFPHFTTFCMQPNFAILLILVCSFYSYGDWFASPCLVLKLLYNGNYLLAYTKRLVSKFIFRITQVEMCCCDIRQPIIV